MHVTALPANFTGIVKFTAEWCGPCKRIQTQLAEACIAAGVELLEIDVDGDSTVPASFGVSAMPTISFIAAGTEVKDLRVVGANMSQISEHINIFTSSFLPEVNQIELPVDTAARVQCLLPSSTQAKE